MGRRGPVPEPTKLKQAKGVTRPSELNYAEPQPRTGFPPMPADMDDRAKRVWQHVATEMGQTDVIVGADADVLRMYCEAVSRYVVAQEMYRVSPLVTRGKFIDYDGKERPLLVKSPMHQVVRDNAEQVRLFARELGLSPSARASLHVAAQGTGATSIDDDLGPPPRLRVVGGTYE